MIKPRISLRAISHEQEPWVCMDRDFTAIAYGSTPQQAYIRWRLDFDAWVHRKVS